MFNRNKSVTICVDSKYIADIETFLKNYIKTYGSHFVYIANGNSFTTVKTKTTANEIANKIEEVLYKSMATICGNTIVVSFDN